MSKRRYRFACMFLSIVTIAGLCILLHDPVSVDDGAKDTAATVPERTDAAPSRLLAVKTSGYSEPSPVVAVEAIDVRRRFAGCREIEDHWDLADALAAEWKDVERCCLSLLDETAVAQSADDARLRAVILLALERRKGAEGAAVTVSEVAGGLPKHDLGWWFAARAEASLIERLIVKTNDTRVLARVPAIRLSAMELDHVADHLRKRSWTIQQEVVAWDDLGLEHPARIGWFAWRAARGDADAQRRLGTLILREMIRDQGRGLGKRATANLVSFLDAPARVGVLTALLDVKGRGSLCLLEAFGVASLTKPATPDYLAQIERLTGSGARDGEAALAAYLRAIPGDARGLELLRRYAGKHGPRKAARALCALPASRAIGWFHVLLDVPHTAVGAISPGTEAVVGALSEMVDRRFEDVPAAGQLEPDPHAERVSGALRLAEYASHDDLLLRRIHAAMTALCASLGGEHRAYYADIEVPFFDAEQCTRGDNAPGWTPAVIEVSKCLIWLARVDPSAFGDELALLDPDDAASGWALTRFLTRCGMCPSEVLERIVPHLEEVIDLHTSATARASALSLALSVASSEEDIERLVRRVLDEPDGECVAVMGWELPGLYSKGRIDLATLQHWMSDVVERSNQRELREFFDELESSLPAAVTSPAVRASLLLDMERLAQIQRIEGDARRHLERLMGRLKDAFPE